MATCQQLSQELQLLSNLIMRVQDPAEVTRLAELRNRVLAEYNQQGCGSTITRTLSGTLTIWDSASLSIPQLQTTLHLTILVSTGGFSFTLDPIAVPNSQVTISLVQGQLGTGFYAETTGYMDLNAPLLIQGVPVVGSVTFNLVLSTTNQIQPSPPQSITGQPFTPGATPAKGVLVGQTPVQVSVESATIWAELAGTLS